MPTPAKPTVVPQVWDSSATNMSPPIPDTLWTVGYVDDAEPAASDWNLLWNMVTQWVVWVYSALLAVTDQAQTWTAKQTFSAGLDGTTTTQAALDNSTKLASTAYADAAVATSAATKANLNGNAAEAFAASAFTEGGVALASKYAALAGSSSQNFSANSLSAIELQLASQTLTATGAWPAGCSVLVYNGSLAGTVTLPARSGYPQGAVLIFVNETGSTVNFAMSGTDTFAGAGGSSGSGIKLIVAATSGTWVIQ